jgi:hypothetical protein
MGAQGGLWDWYLSHSAFLYDVIFGKGWFYIDHWSLVHCWSGAVLITLLASLRFRNRWFWLVFFLTAYEVLEVSFVFVAWHIFRPERLNDQLMDVLIGSVAAMGWNLLLVNMEVKTFRRILMGFASATMAFPVAGIAIRRIPAGVSGMDWILLGLLTLAGTLYLLALRALKVRNFAKTTTMVVPWMVLAFALWTLVPVGLWTRMALTLLVPAGIAGFYRWYVRQTERARLFLGVASITDN